MEISGKIIEIGSVQQVSETFRKRELVIEYAENESYPEYIKFELLQDKVALLDGLRVGEKVDVSYNLKGKAFTNREGVTGYFTSLVVWRISK